MKHRLIAVVGALPRLLLLLGLGVVLVIFLAGVAQGFDFTDEGNYYLSFVHPENVSDNQTSYFLFGGRIFALLGHQIVAMRVCTLLATLGGTLIFLRGVRQFAQRFSPELLPDREHQYLALYSALVASFLGYGISPAALSYNFQNAFCLLAATGFLLNACAQPSGEKFSGWHTVVALAGFGALAGLEFFIKFSSSVPLVLAGGLFFFLVSTGSIRQKAARAGLLLLCGGGAMLLYFGFFQSFSHWWTGIVGTVNGLAHGNYVTGEIRRYDGEIAALFLTTLWNFVPVWIVALLASAVVIVLRLRPRGQRIFAALAGSGMLVHLLNRGMDLEYHSSPSLPFFLASLWLLGLLVAASRLAIRDSSQTRRPGHWRVVLAAGLLFGLPYIGAFGTNNNINGNCFYQLAPWFVIAAGLLAELDRLWRTAWPSRLGLLMLAGMAGSDFYNSYWELPYRVAGKRIEQTEPTAIGDPASTLRLTPGTHEFITTSRRILQEHGFKPGDDLLVFFNLPGFVFAMGGISPGYPWYYQGDPHVLDLDLMRLRFVEPERLRRAFIVRNTLNWDDFLPYMRQAGLRFPEDYQLITPPMKSPFTGVPFEIWQPVATTMPR